MSDINFDTCNHSLNPINCGTCLSGYPVKCSCGGHVHAEIRKNNFSGITVVYKCDHCDFILEAMEE